MLSIDNAVCCRASIGSAPEVGTPLQAGISLTKLCLDTGEILLSSDTNTDRRLDSVWCKETGIRSVLVLPIKDNEKIMGVLEVMSVRPNAFTQHDADTLSELADQVVPLLSELASTRDLSLDPLPSNNIGALRDSRKLSGHADVLKDDNNSQPIMDAAEADQWNGHEVVSKPDRSILRMKIITLLAAMVILATIVDRYSRNHTKGAPPVAKPSASKHEPSIPQQHVLPEQASNTNGQPKTPDNVLTASRQEVIQTIQEAVQGTDINRTLKRANAGDSIAQYEMALRYADGEGGPQNYQDAMAWFAKASARGSAKAQWKLSLGYMKGIGVSQDEGKAVLWLKRAANNGDTRAQRALSDIYLSGRGVPRDYVRAYTWANIAARLRGNDSDRLRVIRSRMTPIQIEDAQRRTSIWWEYASRRATNPDNSQKTATPEAFDR